MQQLLSLFNLRPIERTLYETLFYGDFMSASQLAKRSGISRTSAYDLLENLIDIGLVIETTKAGVKMFAVQPPEKLQLLLEEKQNKLKRAGRELNFLEKIYQEKTKSSKPRLQLFEGRPALQQMMKDMLLYRDMTVLAYWPVRNVIKLLTPDFLEQFHQERVSRNVKLKVIWPKNQIPSIKQYPFLKVSSELKREVRIAPSSVDFSLGYAIYGNIVRFISSSKKNFGFLVESQELAEMIKSQWQVIWNVSRPFSPKKIN